MEQEITDVAPADEPRASLTDILGRRELVERAQEPAGQREPSAATPPAPETGEAAAQRARDEAGRFAPKPEAGPPPARDPEEGRIAALKAEREKRQALERKIAEYEARLAAPPAAQAPAIPQTPKQPAQNFWDDPEAYVAAQREEMAKQMAEQTRGVRLDLAREMVRSAHPDYDEAESALYDYVERVKATNDPAMLAQVNAIAAAINHAPNPAMKALELGREAKNLRDANYDPQAALERRIQAEVDKRLAAMQPAAPPAPDQAPAPRLPGSLASARAAAPRAASTYQGSKPLTSILGPRR